MKFDAYTMQARLLPAFFFMIPFYVELNYYIVKLGFNISLSATLGNIFLSGILLIIGNWCRYKGREKEKQLFEIWDGAPTTRFLRYRNSEYNINNRENVRNLLRKMYPDLHMPTEKEERQDPSAADMSYKAFVSNLRATTREDRFSLLHCENRNYGMWRNMFAIKPIAISIIVISALLNFGVFIVFEDIMPLQALIAISAGYLLALLFWILIVNQRRVCDVANVYAERLFETCIRRNE